MCIKNLYYGVKDLKIGVVESVIKLFDNFFNYKIYYEGGLLMDKCLNIFLIFFKNKWK